MMRARLVRSWVRSDSVRTRQFSFFGWCEVKGGSARELLRRHILLARVDQRLAPFEVQPAPVWGVFLSLRKFVDRQIRLVLGHERLAPTFQRICKVRTFLVGKPEFLYCRIGLVAIKKRSAPIILCKWNGG